MKKIALGILSVFMILGGVLFTVACDKKVSLSVSVSEVVIYTNDEQETNYKQTARDVEVLLENSDAGIDVKIIQGQGKIRYSEPVKIGNGKYSFTIFGDNSGDGIIRVSAKDDIRQAQNISVTVNTLLEDMRVLADDNAGDGSNLFVIKGERKELIVENYFELLPYGANVYDFVWTFEETEGTNQTDKTQLFDNGNVIAKIEAENGKAYLTVESGYASDDIAVRATFKRKNVYQTVAFDVLESSTIQSMTLDDGEGMHIVYNNGILASTNALNYDLKRNKENLSNLSGTIVVNTKYDVELQAVFLQKQADGTYKELIFESDERKKYFEFESAQKNPVGGNADTTTYTFVVDASDDRMLNKCYGEFLFYLVVKYKDYAHSITTEKAQVIVNSSYTAQIVNLLNEKNDNINNSEIDVFSSYTVGNGYVIKTAIEPEDVSVDNSDIQICIDANQVGDIDSVAKFYYKGDKIDFVKEGAMYRSAIFIPDGTQLYVVSAGEIDIVEDVVVKFQSVGNIEAYSLLTMNFYKVSSEKNLTVLNAEDGADIETSYLSTSTGSDIQYRKHTYRLKIDGLTSTSGLTLKYQENPKFKFSNVTTQAEDGYVLMQFDVEANGYNFSDSTKFWLEHVTGRKSQEFSVEGFIALTGVSVENGDKTASNVYVQSTSEQSYAMEVYPEGHIDTNDLKSQTLSKLSMEAGSSLPLIVNYNNADIEVVNYYFLPISSLIASIDVSDYEGEDKEAEKKRRAYEIFDNADFDVVKKFDFTEINGTPFVGEDGVNFNLSITNGKLNLTDNEFKGFLRILVTGYNQEHQKISAIRYLSLESFYAVSYLSSDVSNKVLYTDETLSIANMDKSYINVSVAMRVDSKLPTYAQTLDNFAFSSSNAGVAIYGDESNIDWEIFDGGQRLKNSYYTVSDIRIVNGRFLKFRITANSTKLMSQINDILTVEYKDERNFIQKEMEIVLTILNEKRIESVQWLNSTADNEIYLNLTSKSSNEKEFTISTSVSPSEADDTSLYSRYFATEGSAQDLKIVSTTVGQTFNLNINTDKGGYGDLYLLPNDMIKLHEGVESILLYKYQYDEHGHIVGETTTFERVSSLPQIYSNLINGCDAYDNYFVNNDDEKIYYSDIILKILVTIADGTSEGTAIRVYNQADLENVDTGLFYKIMNNITLSNWKAYDRFSGMIFGDNSSITLKFEDASQGFVNYLTGTIKDLTFAGKVSNFADEYEGANVAELKNAWINSAGFVANVNNGLVENVCVDVSSSEGIYGPSSLTSDVATAVGGIVGTNNGTIKNSFSFGLTIESQVAKYTGGIAGENIGTITGSGVEFYLFAEFDDFGNVKKDASENVLTYKNKISASGHVGGIAGFGAGGSLIEKSYAYAYSLTLEADNDSTQVLYSAANVNQRGAFLGSYNQTDGKMAKIEESFVFIGDLKNPANAPDSNTSLHLKNSYLTYYSNGTINSRMFIDSKIIYTNQNYGGSGITDDLLLEASDIPSDYADEETWSNDWKKLISGENKLDESVWELQNIDTENNFGFMYLKNSMQSAEVEVNGLEINSNQENSPQAPLKSLNSGEGLGILFVYTTTAIPVYASQQSQLANINTISFADLFGVSQQQAKSLIITTTNKSISVGTNSIKMLRRDIDEFEITVHSKMNFTASKTFKVVVLNYLPELKTIVEKVQLQNGQTVLLQTNTWKNIEHQLDGTIFLAGEAYSTEKERFSVEWNCFENSGEGYVQADEDNYVQVSKMTLNSIGLYGHKSHENGEASKLTSYITIDAISRAEFAETIKEKYSRDFFVSVYDGATNLVANSNEVTVKASQYAVFDVTMVSDSMMDNLYFELFNGEVSILNENAFNSTTSGASFTVDEKLKLNFSWAKKTIYNVSGGYLYDNYRVVIKIDDEVKHLIDKNYENLTIKVGALSQKGTGKCVDIVGLKVETQQLETLNITTYLIESRQIRNSVLYITPASEITSVLVPSSDAIVVVQANPAFAYMTDFDLTCETTTSGQAGVVSITRLVKHPNFGYYVNSNSTSTIENGLRVTLSDADKRGDGVYYFRIYVSSAFNASSDLKLNLTFYNDGAPLKSVSRNLRVDYLQEANIKVNGQTTYAIAKGSSAKVEVTTGIDQNLTNLYLQNNETNISLSAWMVEEFASYKVYTAYVTVGLKATLIGEDGDSKESGLFYVCADVQRVINNKQEIKTSRATLCLVDFSVDGSGISVNGKSGQRSYRGKMYDTMYAYINSKEELTFNYPILPEIYNYDPNNADEVEAVKELNDARNTFALKNSYKDEDVKYYINYKLNETTGIYEEKSLREQLWYADSESYASAIYNGEFISNNIFTFEETTTSLENGEEVALLSITGKRTGTQLMKLQTTIIYQGIEFVYEYYFLIIVEVYSDEEAPTQITTAEEFVNFATNSELADDYILMNDIVLTNYTPVSTELFDSLDGNGYTIHLNSFAMPDSTSLDLALFSEVTTNTTLKNVRVNIYNGGQISVNVNRYSDINIAGFALENNGIIYNCEVVAYYDDEYQTRLTGDVGLVVKYTYGDNTDPVVLVSSESVVSGFVTTNNSSIMNSRVGGEEFRHIVDIAGRDFIKTQILGTFVVEGQGEVSGFVNTNSNMGYVSASFADNLQIYNNLDSTQSITAGFVVYNENIIQGSYVEAVGRIFDDENEPVVYNNLSNITSLGVVAGFVYTNSKTIKNSYANIAIENTVSKPVASAGFVYINNPQGSISLCYAACEMPKNDINQMYFSGVSGSAESLNEGEITLSYFYASGKDSDSIQTTATFGALAIGEVVDNEEAFYGFSFASSEDSYDGIWVSTENGITLVSANKIALSNRYAVTTNGLTSVFYNKAIIDSQTMKVEDLSYGGENNPIIIRNAVEFARATGNATTKEISSYKEHYTDTEVNGYYRIVNNLDFSEIDQNSQNVTSVKLTTTKKTFTGLLDGNGFTISNINLGSSEVLENYGLFANLERAVVMNLDLIVESVHNVQANMVGTLAGTAVDTRIMAITLSPVTTGEENDSTLIQGKNIVGGIVGMLFGESRLHDIDINDIYIYSSYSSDKDIDSNIAHTGFTLRTAVQSNFNLIAYTDELSYAGAIAGYVDIYRSTSDDYVRFNSAPDISEFDVATVHVSDAVNIYGEVVGGLFGYVGESTLIYDATITLDANDNLDNASYIISRNLFAGGLIGENYGGLFAVKATYEESLQTTIEENENDYYRKNVNVEKGQQSIFSYADISENQTQRTNDPLYVGGLVGYMGGGYINIGYSKLNVNIHKQEENGKKVDGDTKAVGGIVGLIGSTENSYELTTISNEPRVDVFFNEVYSSGDVSNANGVSSGIIGALKISNNSTPVVAMQNVMAVNYYSYEQDRLAGDKVAASPQEDDPTTEENEANILTSSHHFMLIGDAFDVDNNNAQALKDSKKTISYGEIYFINSESDSFNVINEEKTTTMVGAYTVGGYNYVKVGTGETKYEVRPFGLENGAWTGYFEEQENIVSAESIGGEKMQTIPAAYARLSSYFLPVGWSDEYWVHEEGKLFPEIELEQRLNFMFWDVFNTKEVLSAMKNSSMTIVLRGQVSKDDDSEFADIDLVDFFKTNPDLKNLLPIEGFSGTLISYYDYMGDNTKGFVTKETKALVNDSMTTIGGSSGRSIYGDKVGIILSKEMFKTLDAGAEIEGINFYFYSENGTIAHKLVEGKTIGATLRGNRIVLNNDVRLATQKLDLKEEYSVGLITSTAYSTSFINTTIELRNSAKIEMVHEAKVEDTEAYIGLLAGYMEQQSSFVRMSVQNLNVVQDSADEICVTYRVSNTTKTLYAGLVAGQISKKDRMARVSVGLSTISGVNINITDKTNDDSLISATTGEGIDVAYIGGTIGMVKGVDDVSLARVSTENNGVVIKQYMPIQTLYAGIGFGQVQSGGNFELSSGEAVSLKGSIYQVGSETTTKKALIGGIAGEINSSTVISNFSVDFTLGKIEFSDETEKLGVRNFDKNDYSYKANYKKDEEGATPEEVVSGYVVTGSDKDNSCGGFFGLTNNSIKISGNCNVSGTIDIDNNDNNISENSTISIGGMVGKANKNVQIAVEGKNSMNISISSGDDAYVGGLVGWANVSTSGEQETSGSFEINKDSPYGYYHVNGIVISDCSKLIYGGALGYTDRKDNNTGNNNISISKVVYGGAVKVYGDGTIGDLTVGGIVGGFTVDHLGDEKSSNSNSGYSISDCHSYGDVFVNYRDNGSSDVKLSAYNFGGIVGVASQIVVDNCSSIMTSFNNKDANVYDSEKPELKQSVGAIVGANADCVWFSGNKYSSGVNLTYQMENGNLDCAYGEIEGTYAGYSTKVSNSAKDEDTAQYETSENILDKFKQLGIDFSEFEAGHKLIPFEYTEYKTLEKGADEGQIAGHSNNISWVALKDNLTISEVIADTFVNMAFVGNGKTITRSEDATGFEGENLGGLVNALGKEFDSNDADSNTPNFNVISGLVLNLKIETIDVNGTENIGSTYFGGIAGTSNGQSFIYGVGVKGTLSVGGAGNALHLAGLVGNLNSGRVEECYVDADLTYRASTGGSLSGITTCGNLNSLVKATYSSGLLHTYIDIPMYTFANATARTNNNCHNYVVDCYSISQIKRENIDDGGLGEQQTYFVRGKGGSETNAPISLSGLAINGSDGVENGGTNVNVYEIEDMALSYNATAEQLKDQMTLKEGDGAITTWYVSPYVNYGYASHGFGYLKNVTTYKITCRDSDTEEVEGQGTLQTDNCDSLEHLHTYTPVAYSEILSASGTENDWYLGVPNVYKFGQMLDTIAEKEVDGKTTFAYDASTSKYLLRYGFGLSKIDSKLGKNAGNVSAPLEIDGNGNTLDMTGVTKSLFNAYIGNLSNLRMININMSSVNGALAYIFVGNLTNITAVGNLKTTGNWVDVGGLVGTFKNGDAKNIDSAINVDSAQAQYLGGVFGLITSEGYVDEQGNSKAMNLSYISNAGIVNSTTTNSTAGGIVGRVAGANVAISNSYNSNSVLSGFANNAKENGSNSYTAGGIVGASSTALTIDNCHNLGLVGAGNYSFIGQSYAGGIVGNGGGSATVTKCSNDGRVEALGKITDDQQKDYTLTSKLVEEEDVGVHDTILYENGQPSVSVWRNKDNVKNLKYEVTITYGETYTTRMVHAYGVGFGISASGDNASSNNYTSTYNVINDGWLGRIQETQTIELDRKGKFGTDFELDNNLYQAKFMIDHYKSIASDTGNIQSKDVKPNIYMNGYDAYGFPSRVYMVDSIQRTFTEEYLTEMLGGSGKIGYRQMFWGTYDFKAGDWTTATVSRKSEGFEINETGVGQAFHNYADYLPIGTWTKDQESEIYNLKNDKGETVLRDYISSGIYLGGTAMQYASYARFLGYDELLKAVNLEGAQYEIVNVDEISSFKDSYDITTRVVTYGENGNAIIKGGGYNAVNKWDEDITLDKGETNSPYKLVHIQNSDAISTDEEVNTINNERSSSQELKNITINGVETAVVYNGTQVGSIYLPYTYTTTIDISGYNIDLEQLSASDIIVDKDSNPAIQYVDTKIDSTNGQITITLYCSGVLANPNVKVTINCTTEEKSFTLGRNNVVEVDGNRLILLTPFIEGLDKAMFDAIKAENSEYSLEVLLGEENNLVSEDLANLLWSDEENPVYEDYVGAYITTEKALQYLKGKSLTVKLTTKTTETEEFEAAVNVANGSLEFDLDASEVYEVNGESVKGQTTFYVGAVPVSVTEDWYSADGETVVGKVYNLGEYKTEGTVIFGETGDDVTFGYEYVTKDGVLDWWSVTETAFDGVSWESDGGILTDNLIIEPKSGNIEGIKVYCKTDGVTVHSVDKKIDVASMTDDNHIMLLKTYMLSGETTYEITENGATESVTFGLDYGYGDNGELSYTGTFEGTSETLSKLIANGMLTAEVVNVVGQEVDNAGELIDITYSVTEVAVDFDYYLSNVVINNQSGAKLGYESVMNFVEKITDGSGETDQKTFASMQVGASSGQGNILSYSVGSDVYKINFNYNVSTVSAVDEDGNVIEDYKLVISEGDFKSIVFTVGDEEYSAIKQEFGTFDMTDEKGNVITDEEGNPSQETHICPCCGMDSGYSIETIHSNTLESGETEMMSYTYFSCCNSVAVTDVVATMTEGEDETISLNYTTNNIYVYKGKTNTFEYRKQTFDATTLTFGWSAPTSTEEDIKSKILDCELPAVVDFDEKNVLFAKAPTGEYKISATQEVEGGFENVNTTVTLTNNVETQQLSGLAGKPTGNNIVLEIEENGVWTEKDLNETYSASGSMNDLASYQGTEYAYRWKYSTTSAESFEGGSEGKNNDIKIVILGSDIYLNNAIGDNARTIIGDGYNLSFVANTSLIKENSTTIKNLNVIGNVDLSTSVVGAKNYSMFAYSHDKEKSIDRLNVYGSIRNVSGSKNDVTVAPLIATGNKDNSTNYIAGYNYQDIESSVTIFGNDISNDKSVKTLLSTDDEENATYEIHYSVGYKLYDYKFKEGTTDNSALTSHDILIGGHGKNGEKAIEGWKTADDGNAGKNGAKISFDVAPKLARVGRGGYGSYGANGKDGYFDENYNTYYKANVGGRAGGDNGMNGQDGSTTGVSVSLLANKQTYFDGQEYFNMNSKANPGCAALGVIDVENNWYYSVVYPGNGYNSVSTGTYWRRNRTSNHSTYGSTAYNNRVSGGSHYYLLEKREKDSDNYFDTTRWDDEVKSNIGYHTDEAKKTNYVPSYISKMNVVIRVDYTIEEDVADIFDKYWFVDFATVTKYEKIVFSSWEDIHGCEELVGVTFNGDKYVSKSST